MTEDEKKKIESVRCYKQWLHWTWADTILPHFAG